MLRACTCCWCRALRPDASTKAAAAIVATGGVGSSPSGGWRDPQAGGGGRLGGRLREGALKRQVVRLADAETTRWFEWGLQNYFRVLLGVAFVLVGASDVTEPPPPGWLGVLWWSTGLLSLSIGFSVGYEGLAESSFREAAGIAFQLRTRLRDRPARRRPPYPRRNHDLAAPHCESP